MIGAYDCRIGGPSNPVAADRLVTRFSKSRPLSAKTGASSVTPQPNSRPAPLPSESAGNGSGDPTTLNEGAGDLTDDDVGVAAFLTLGDDVVRNLLDVLQRLDRLRGIIEDTKSTLLQVGSASIDLRDLVARLEADIRSANSAMLAITGHWLMSSPGRGGPLTIRSTPAEGSRGMKH
ncbi:hypothetical protein [Nocardia tengchongensis]|uniref:hypothetical protein n=1 Tax=Nocardia tengchongensis TaxID=2055889 RepID=UPI0036900B7A